MNISELLQKLSKYQKKAGQAGGGNSLYNDKVKYYLHELENAGFNTSKLVGGEGEIEEDKKKVEQSLIEQKGKMEKINGLLEQYKSNIVTVKDALFKNERENQKLMIECSTERGKMEKEIESVKKELENAKLSGEGKESEIVQKLEEKEKTILEQVTKIKEMEARIEAMNKQVEELMKSAEEVKNVKETVKTIVVDLPKHNEALETVSEQLSGFVNELKSLATKPELPPPRVPAVPVVPVEEEKNKPVETVVKEASEASEEEKKKKEEEEKQLSLTP